MQIEARLVLVGSTTESGHRSIGQHHLECHHVIPGHPILEAARPTGIGGDVAPDGAISPTGRIRRIVKPLTLHGLLQRCGHHAGLHHRHEIRRADFEDPIHSRHGKGDAAVHRNTPAHIAMSCPARGHRNLVLRGKGEDSRHRLHRSRQGHRLGQVRCKPLVARMGGQGFRGKNQLSGRQLPRQTT